MDEEKKNRDAMAVYNTIIDNLNKRNWVFDRYDDSLMVRFTVGGDDLNISYRIIVEPECGLIVLYSNMPFSAKPEKALDITLAIAAINSRLADGSFEYDMNTSEIRFKMTNSYVGCKVFSELMDYMIDFSGVEIDDYNDKLYALNMGYVSINDLLKEWTQ